MAAPSKNLLTPTGLSVRPLTYFNLYSGNMVFKNKFVNTMPMFFNPLGTRFLLVNANTSEPVSRIKLNTTSKFLNKPSVYLANTFPAVYTTTTSIRPSYGQLWPLSGSMPY